MKKRSEKKREEENRRELLNLSPLNIGPGALVTCSLLPSIMKSIRMPKRQAHFHRSKNKQQADEKDQHEAIHF